MAKPIAKAVQSFASQIYVYDPNENTKAYCDKNNYIYCDNNIKLTQQCSLVLLLIKPQVMHHALSEIAPHASAKCFVSFAPGITIDALKCTLGNNAHVMRAMPNTPMQLGFGATALAEPCPLIPIAYVQLLENAFSSVGICVRVKESQLDMTIALSGSTPALFYQLVNHIAQFGEQLNIPAETALLLATQAMRGAAEMLLTYPNPDKLSAEVASKGGTTEHMLHTLNSNDFYAALHDGLTACLTRAKELSS